MRGHLSADEQRQRHRTVKNWVVEKIETALQSNGPSRTRPRDSDAGAEIWEELRRHVHSSRRGDDSSENVVSSTRCVKSSVAHSRREYSWINIFDHARTLPRKFGINAASGLFHAHRQAFRREKPREISAWMKNFSDSQTFHSEFSTIRAPWQLSDEPRKKRMRNEKYYLCSVHYCRAYYFMRIEHTTRIESMDKEKGQ